MLRCDVKKVFESEYFIKKLCLNFTAASRVIELCRAVVLPLVQ